MQTITSKPDLRPDLRRDPRRDLRPDVLPVLAGGAAAASGVGAALALAGADSPLRAPLALFYLLVAPAAGLAAALRPLARPARLVLSAAGAVLIDLSLARSLRILDIHSVEAGVTSVAAITFLLFLIGIRNRLVHFSPGRKKK
ncbi:hypothetical protein [Streptomyces sp. NPDC059909]|uniref:hypothetical protein n=1 Tax=Streptomyces sp. NPDC059909 TaxID=3346998 RepID=UPI003667996A